MESNQELLIFHYLLKMFLFLNLPDYLQRVRFSLLLVHLHTYTKSYYTWYFTGQSSSLCLIPLLFTSFFRQPCAESENHREHHLERHKQLIWSQNSFAAFVIMGPHSFSAWCPVLLPLNHRLLRMQIKWQELILNQYKKQLKSCWSHHLMYHGVGGGLGEGQEPWLSKLAVLPWPCRRKKKR